MRITTFCLLTKKGKTFLAMKKRGFGRGKWNGFGGKAKSGESVKLAALRELKEEVSIKANPDKMKAAGMIKFRFKEHPEWNQNMYVFLVNEWKGMPQETEEMKPRWYNNDEIPFKEMWCVDRYWLPSILAGKKISGRFYYKAEGQNCDRFEVQEI